MLRSISLTAALVVLVVACGGQSAPATGAAHSLAATQGAQPTQAAPATAAAAPGGAGTSVVHVVVGSGPQAGTYDSSGDKSDCNLSSTGSGATYIDTNKTDGVTSFIFSSIEGGPQVSKFYAQALFGAFSLTQPSVEIDTLDPSTAKGSGTATMQDNGATIKWSIDGKTADGVALTATVECGPVDRR